MAISRAGASSLAELAAMRVPAVLVPYPAATDNHQFYNARAFEATGAACLLEQQSSTPETLAQLLLDVIEKPAVHEKMQAALAQWHAPRAAEQIAEAMLALAGAGAAEGCRADAQPAATPTSRTADTGNSPTSSGSSPANRLQVSAADGYKRVLHQERAA
jgi:UDP-N-acetylglucosamine--N-acetylmuramyl-(pentapeptide) pyrophosphoryl-undecaprenol N-acetylglucosamine transferase